MWLWIVCFAALIWLTGCGTSSNTPGGEHGRGLRASGSAEEGAVVLQPRESSDQNVSRSSASSANPHATFKGCWYKKDTHRYQAVDMAVGTSGTYAFNAILYHGTTCNTNDFADQFGFGQSLNLGEANYIFWFTDFADKTNMSALWYLGDEKSQCVSYAHAPNC